MHYLLPILCALLCFGATPVFADDPPRLRVMSYNIHHGRGTDGVIDLERIAAVINAANVDLVALQEVDVKTGRSGRVDQLAELARLTDMHARFAKGRDYDGGDYGQAVLSRVPIESFQVHPLPPATEADKRIAASAVIAPQRGLPRVVFVTTHLHHQSEEFRLQQVARLGEILQPHLDSPLILVGDVNARPGSPVVNELLQTYQDTTSDDALTYPSTAPDRKIDYILLPKCHRWRVVHSEVIDEPLASDHRPVLAELEWLGESSEQKGEQP
jgi:endonuclease/exonuclease/phosphatase family metal-dependent hydrolase